MMGKETITIVHFFQDIREVIGMEHEEEHVSSQLIQLFHLFSIPPPHLNGSGFIPSFSCLYLSSPHAISNISYAHVPAYSSCNASTCELQHICREPVPLECGAALHQPSSSSQQMPSMPCPFPCLGQQMAPFAQGCFVRPKGKKICGGRDFH